MRKAKDRKVRRFVQGHLTSKWELAFEPRTAPLIPPPQLCGKDFMQEIWVMESILQKTDTPRNSLSFIRCMCIWDCRMGKIEVAISRGNWVSCSCFELTLRVNIKKWEAQSRVSSNRHSWKSWFHAESQTQDIYFHTPDRLLACSWNTRCALGSAETGISMLAWKPVNRDKEKNTHRRFWNRS